MNADSVKAFFVQFKSFGNFLKIDFSIRLLQPLNFFIRQNHPEKDTCLVEGLGTDHSISSILLGLKFAKNVFPFIAKLALNMGVQS